MLASTLGLQIPYLMAVRCVRYESLPMMSAGDVAGRVKLPLTSCSSACAEIAICTVIESCIASIYLLVYVQLCCHHHFPLSALQLWLLLTMTTTKNQLLDRTKVFGIIPDELYRATAVHRYLYHSHIANWRQLTHIGRLCLFRHLDLRASAILAMSRKRG